MSQPKTRTPEAILASWEELHRIQAAAKKVGNYKHQGWAAKQIKELYPLYLECVGHKTTQTPVKHHSLDQRLDHANTTESLDDDTGIISTNSVQDTHIPFQFYLVSGSQRTAVLCDRVFNLWLQSRRFKRTPSSDKLQDYARIIETIVCNLLYCLATGRVSGRDFGKDAIRFSRERASYASHSRYRPAHFNERFLAVIDQLEAIGTRPGGLGILKQEKGDKWRVNPAHKYFPDEHKSAKTYGLKQTSITPGKGLGQELQKLSIRPSMVDVWCLHEGREVIILKKGEGSQLLEYKDSDFPNLEKCRRQMQIINDMLMNAGDLVSPEGQDQYDQRQRFLVRRFTHASTESGGRLWEGFWINGMKRTARPAMLRLNGEVTAELDFSSMIVRLAYIVAEKPCPAGDQYHVPGLDPKSRDGIKRVMGALLFDSSRNRDRMPKDVAKLFTPKDQKKGWAQIKRLIMAHHRELRAYIDRGLGHYLQYLESQVLVNVLVRCAKGGVLALPLHDCIIVPRSQVIKAKVLIEKTVTYMFGPGASIPVTVKGSGEDEGTRETAA